MNRFPPRVSFVSLRSCRRVALVAGAWLAAAARPVAAQHDMARMSASSSFSASSALAIPLARMGSATSWVPDSSPMYAAHRTSGDWMLMLHGAAFLQYDQQNGFRGARQLGLVDWEMLSAFRPAAGGLFRVDAMTSLEPLVLGNRGYPELVQTGGVFEDGRLVNYESPHALVTELSGQYEHSIMSNLGGSVYVAAFGEPALGPGAYAHRPSAEDDPFAPIGHHWEDATHGSSGVVTAGIFSRAVKLEGSVFNAREPKDDRFMANYDGARLDSYAGRLTVAPTANVTLAAWGGYIYAHDPLDDPIGMQRYGASILTVSRGVGGGAWSNGIVWGLNVHHHSARLHTHTPGAPTFNYSAAALIESSLDVGRDWLVFGRVEQVQKSADDLGFLGGEPMQLFTVRAASLGATRDVRSFGSASLGVGVRGTLNLLPETLRLTYQTTTPIGFAIYARIRPRAMH